MADIQTEIFMKYEIDIARENILKLYKINSADISSQELENRLQDARKRWELSINGANEKNAERDRIRLEKADKYESILRNETLREKLFRYYNKASGEAADSGGSTEFAKEYFQLIATTKKVRKADVDFFFQYYQSERKNKKAILEMLSRELKISDLSKQDADGEEEEDFQGKQKDNSSPFVVNLFQKATILKLRRAIEKYEEARKSNELCMYYPKLNEGLYEFLEIKNIDEVKEFNALISEKGKEVYAVRQEKGAECILLVDLFNILEEVGKYQDVADNIPEFKLLLKYPDLTPYMYSFVEMKPGTVKTLIHIANRDSDHTFRDETDFILNYYQPIHDNFGITSSGIGQLIRRAEKRTKQNRLLNIVDEILGRNKKKFDHSFGIEIIHWLVYLPIFAAYCLFEAAEIFFTKLRIITFPAFFFLIVLFNWSFPKTMGIENLLVLRKIFSKAQWLEFLRDFIGSAGENWFETIVLSLIVIIILLAVYVVPACFGSMFIEEFADDFNKGFDWGGYERTFRNVLQIIRRKMQDQYRLSKKVFIKRSIPKIIINVICLVLFIVLIRFIPFQIRKWIK